MAAKTKIRKSGAAPDAEVLAETLVSLRRAQKSAGSTKWELQGAEAKRNPPTPERAKALRAKLSGEQARVKELRVVRDRLRAADPAARFVLAESS